MDLTAPLQAEVTDALKNGDSTKVAALLPRIPVATDDVDDSAVPPLVFTAAAGGSVPCLRLLHGAGFNLFVQWTGTNPDALQGELNPKGAATALHAAAANGRLAALRFLIHDVPVLEQAKGKRHMWIVDQQDPSWETPVSCAANAGHLPCVRHLAEVCGADTSVDCMYDDGWGNHRTAIHAALEGYLSRSFASKEAKCRGAAMVERMAFSYSFEFRWHADLYGDGFVFPHDWSSPCKDALLPYARTIQLSGVCAAPVEGLRSGDRVGFARGKIIAAHLPPTMVKDALATAAFRVTSAFADPSMKSAKRRGAGMSAAHRAAHTLRRTFAAELLILKRALAAAALLASLRARKTPPRVLCDVLVSLLRGHAIASRMCLEIPVESFLMDQERLLLLQVTKPFCTAHHNISKVSVETIHEDAARTTTAAAVNGPLQKHLGSTFIGHTLPHAVVPRIVARRVVAPFLPLSAPLALLNSATNATTPLLRRQLCEAAVLVDTEADRIVRCFFREDLARLVGDTWRYSWQHDNGRWIYWWDDAFEERKRALKEEGDDVDRGGWEPEVPRTHGAYQKRRGRNQQLLEYI